MKEHTEMVALSTLLGRSEVQGCNLIFSLHMDSRPSPGLVQEEEYGNYLMVFHVYALEEET